MSTRKPMSSHFKPRNMDAVPFQAPKHGRRPVSGPETWTSSRFGPRNKDVVPFRAWEHDVKNHVKKNKNLHYIMICTKNGLDNPPQVRRPISSPETWTSSHFKPRNKDVVPFQAWEHDVKNHQKTIKNTVGGKYSAT